MYGTLCMGTVSVIAFRQIAVASVIIFVLFAITSGKIRYELAAFGGLLFLALLNIADLSIVFSGFSNPALFTIASVMLMSAGIVESELLRGLGKFIGRKFKSARSQVGMLAALAAGLSAFMNNVGALGIMIPIAKRMADRKGATSESYVLPLVYASILGGATTLIGTASNILVASYRMDAFGESFHMLDYAYHGLIMLVIGFLLWGICQLCGYKPINLPHASSGKPDGGGSDLQIQEQTYSFGAKKVGTLIAVVAVIALTAGGVVSSAVGFGLLSVFFVATGILPMKTAYRALNLRVLIFIGSMISLGRILQETGAVNVMVAFILPFVQTLPSYFVVLSFLFLSGLFANMIDNSASAVLMSPLAISLALSGQLAVSADALLMAVAAGASLGLVLPTHQVTLLAMSHLERFPRGKFVKNGAVIALISSFAAAFIINIIWN